MTEALHPVALLSLVAEFVDPADCRYDHEGNCQAHDLDERPCPHERAKALLAAHAGDALAMPTRGTFAAVLAELAAEHAEAEGRHGFTAEHDDRHGDQDWAWKVLRRVSELLTPATVMVQTSDEQRRALVEIAHIAASAVASHDRRQIAATSLERTVRAAVAADPNRSPVEALMHAFDVDGVATSTSAEWRYVVRAAAPSLLERHALTCTAWRADPPCTGSCAGEEFIVACDAGHLSRRRLVHADFRDDGTTLHAVCTSTKGTAGNPCGHRLTISQETGR